ncbi:MAG: AmmeMemoRadiSam system radical SAM enzyme [Candidatus Micrarchaeota archaeon]|nr:AmmeMemoRadiSam system radical SAM enzyme [Candidatus Micrarchaeota archaeon]
MKSEAGLYSRLRDRRIECHACARLCKIPEGSHGFCFVRQNIGGKLYLMNYGLVEAIQIDPIEKKPFNHFMPGTYVFGIGTSSCNWGCLFCQNHNISKEREVKGVYISPKRAVEMALENNTQSIAYTYNEPTIFIEYALDVARLAHENGLKNVWVTNGYMTKEAVQAMKGLIDAVVVDFKGSGETKFVNKYEAVVSNEPVKEAMLELKKVGIHLELTDLIIPGVGDSIEACNELTKWVADSLGPETPIQFTRFHPDYKMLNYPETPYETLKKHYDIARKNGLNYVYIGNVPGNPYGNTYCPNCGELVIERDGFYIRKWNLGEDLACKKCGREILIIGNRPKDFRYREITALF